MRRPPNTVGGVHNPTPGRNDPCRAAADVSSNIAACCPGLWRSDPHVVLVCAADALQDVDESVSVRSQWLQQGPPLLMKVCGWLASRSLVRGAVARLRVGHADGSGGSLRLHS